MSRTARRYSTFCLVVMATTAVQGQGQNQFQANVFGDQFLITAPPLFLVAPRSVNIGTGATINLGTLNVRGDQMPVADAFTPLSWCTFRTDIRDGRRQNWSMVRQEDDLTPNIDVEVGRLYHGSDFNWFAVQAPQPNGNRPGILWLENAETDGFMLRANGLQNQVNGFNLRCDGFASLGIRTDGTNGMLNIPSRARLHLIDAAGEVEDPWRPYYRNGALFTGNLDLGYVGHRYYEGDHEEPWSYTSDHSDLLLRACLGSLAGIVITRDV